MRTLPIKAAYTLTELARATSMERRALKRLLDRADIEFVRSGRVVYVSLSELEDKVRPIWRGIQAARVLRSDEDRK
jgi:hypothetical protein